MWQKLSLLYSIVLILVAGVFAMARWWWVADVAVSYVPLFLAACLAGLVLTVLHRQTLIGLILVGMVVYFGLPLVQMYYPVLPMQPRDPKIEIRPVTVLQANVHYRNQDPEKLIALVRQHKPDIIALNEIVPSWVVRLKSEFGSMYPYTVDASVQDYRGMAVFSRWKIAQSKAISFGADDSPVLKVVLENPEITLYAIHPLSPITENWWVKRNVYLDLVAQDVAQVTTPVVVAGDFNVTIHSPHFQDFVRQGKLVDAARGYGWLPTWMTGSVLAVPIDHIMYRGEALRVAQTAVLPDIGSDHLPLIVKFIMSQ